MTQTQPFLYSFRRCPYAMRARLALYTAHIDHEHREVDLKNKPAALLEISTKGTVPVLQMADGTVLEQSLDIMQWALKIPQLEPVDQELITENDTTFKYALDRYKYPGRYSEDKDVDYRTQCEQFLKKVEDRLNPFLSGTSPILVDMALFPFIRQFAHVDPEWFDKQNYPHLKKWLDSFATSDLFESIMKNYEPWKDGDKPVLIELHSPSETR